MSDVQWQERGSSRGRRRSIQAAPREWWLLQRHRWWQPQSETVMWDLHLYWHHWTYLTSCPPSTSSRPPAARLPLAKHTQIQTSSNWNILTLIRGCAHWTN